MDRTERFYKIENLLRQRRAVTFAQLLAALEVSPATLKRDLRFMRERLNEPIEWNGAAGGYRWVAGDSEGLHGPWYSASEIHALLTVEQLLAEMDPAGLLAAQVDPLRARLARLLDGGNAEAAELRKRVRIVGLARRASQPRHFQRAATALVQRKRLRIRYCARSTGNESEREISPLRLLHYRENWHLDAWCHLREELRNFAVDAIQDAVILQSAAREVSETRLDAYFKVSYGIFAGASIRWARLRFAPERARWVSNEQWHPDQRGRWDAQAHWLLDVPYADQRELVMDILRHVPEVEVLGPVGLREEVRDRLRAGLIKATRLDK